MAHRVATQGIASSQKLTPLLAASLADRALNQAKTSTNFRLRPELEVLLPRLFELFISAQEAADTIPDSAKKFAATSDDAIKYGYLDTDGAVRRFMKRSMRARREGRAWMQ